MPIGKYVLRCVIFDSKTGQNRFARRIREPLVISDRSVCLAFLDQNRKTRPRTQPSHSERTAGILPAARNLAHRPRITQRHPRNAASALPIASQTILQSATSRMAGLAASDGGLLKVRSSWPPIVAVRKHPHMNYNLRSCARVSHGLLKPNTHS